MLRLTRLKITQFRNVQPTELFFNDGYNILLGPNASGKTTLLNLISACVRGNFSAYKNEAFDIECELQCEDLNIQVSLGQRTDEERQTSPNSSFQEFLHIQYKGPNFSGITKRENATNKIQNHESKNQFTHTVSISIFHIDSWINIMGGILTEANEYKEITYTLGQNLDILDTEGDCLRFDEQLGYYNTLISENPQTAPQISIIVDKKHTYMNFRFTEIPISIKETIEKQALNIMEDNQKIRFTIPNSTECEIFKSLQGWNVFFNFKETQREKIPNGYISFWIISGFEMISASGYEKRDHSILSYGQKRLISFIYYASCHPYIIIADELVNGLHHDWITDCMDLIKDRQSFLTSQNPLLLDSLYFEDAEQVQKTFILCNIERGEDEDQITWKNITERVGEQFFSAYQVGIQHVSEILKTHGLW